MGPVRFERVTDVTGQPIEAVVCPTFDATAHQRYQHRHVPGAGDSRARDRGQPRSARRARAGCGRSPLYSRRGYSRDG